MTSRQNAGTWSVREWRVQTESGGVQLLQVKYCRKADKTNDVTPAEDVNPEDTHRRCTVRRIPAVPSGGGFADYSTMLHLTSLETVFTVVV